MSVSLRNRAVSRNEPFVSSSVWSRVRHAYVSAIASIQARRMLARVIRPYKSRGSPDLSPHLLRDIGLPDDYLQRPRNFWDIR
jgi:hypothetical protein